MFKQIHKQYKNLVPPVWRVPVQVMIFILIVGVVVLVQFINTPTPPLLVNFYDIGQGDGVHIRTADGFDVLIDGGPNDSVVGKLGQNMPFWDKTIELMVLSHPHTDHFVGQIGVLDRFEVEKVLYTGAVHTTDEFLQWLNKIKEKGLVVEIVQFGDSYAVGSGQLEILWPLEDLSGKRIVEQATDNEKGGGLNDASIVARLVFGDFAFLFTGDIGDEAELALLDEGLQSDVLKVAHHGSKYSSSKEFLQVVDPDYAVIQAGKNNSFGHPHFAVLYRLKKQGIEILRNDKDGDVVFWVDQQGLRLR